jgi:hypothetical protein
MSDYVECRNCGEITHLGGLIGKNTNNCPRCGQQVFFTGETMEDQKPNYSSTDAEIVHYYDSHLNLTLRELADMTGRTVAQLKKLIMGGAA